MPPAMKQHAHWLVAGTVFFTAFIIKAAALNNGLGLTPQMGWNSWNHFGCSISETTILETAKALVSTGLAEKGYQYVNIDDCWLTSKRDNQGNMVADPQLFPSGIKWLADQVHDLGLKLGIYGCSGTMTCATRVGSWGFEKQDAQLLADWGVDYLKYDNCNIPKEADNEHISARFGRMRDALNATGRPIFFSIADWGQGAPARWPGKDFGNSWRTGGDIVDTYESIVNIADGNHWFASFSGPGAWNDPDMLEVGNGGMTTAQYRAHFSLWALAKAPLIIGCDVRNMTADTLEILGNEEVIAVNQDSLGIQGSISYGNYMSTRSVWQGPLANNRKVVLLHNRENVTRELSTTCAELGIEALHFQARDLWQHLDLGEFGGRISAFVPPYDVVMLVISYNKDDHRKCRHNDIPKWTARPAPPESHPPPQPPPLATPTASSPLPPPTPSEIPSPSPPASELTPPPQMAASPPEYPLPSSPPPSTESTPAPPIMESLPPPEAAPPPATVEALPPPPSEATPTTPPDEAAPPADAASKQAGASNQGASGGEGTEQEGKKSKSMVVVIGGVSVVVAAVLATVGFLWWSGRLTLGRGSAERGVQGTDSTVAYELVEKDGLTSVEASLLDGNKQPSSLGDEDV